MFNEQVRPVATKAWRRSEHCYLPLALKNVLRRKRMLSFHGIKKHLEIVLTPSLSGNGGRGRLSASSRPMKMSSGFPTSRTPSSTRLLASMLSREHTPMSSILEDLVSRREHLLCLEALRTKTSRTWRRCCRNDQTSRRLPNLGCCPSINSLLFDKASKT